MSHSSFDERAATWDDESKIARAKAIAAAIAEAVPLNSKMTMLEYGAGTGLVTQALQDKVGPVTLADTSAGMRQVMEEKAAAGTLAADARIWDVDLAESPVADETFDVIVTSMVLHHIPDTDAVLRNFAAMLNPGGYVAIVDLDAEDGSFHGEDFDGHHGFDRDDLARRLQDAGFGGVTVGDCDDVERDDGTFPLFLATGHIEAQ